MMCAGLIRFRASLMAMRRTSWIDQRINDGVSVLLWLQLGVAFFLAATDWRDGGSPPSWRRRASPRTRGDAGHARIVSHCDRPFASINNPRATCPGAYYSRRLRSLRLAPQHSIPAIGSTEKTPEHERTSSASLCRRISDGRHCDRPRRSCRDSYQPVSRDRLIR